MLWHHSKCAESPIYQLLPISYFGDVCPTIYIVFISRLAGERAAQNIKTCAILVDMLTYYRHTKGPK